MNYPLRKKSKITNDIDTVPIPKNYFKYGEYKKYTTICLFDKNSKIINKSCFYLYNGNNTAYIETDGKSRSYELIFKNIENIENWEIKIEKKKFDKLDSLKTHNRKRLTLINYHSDSFYINGKILDLPKIIEDNIEAKDKSENKDKKKDKDENLSKSFQISFKNLDEKIYGVKEVESFEELKLNYLFSNSWDLQQFSGEFESLLKSFDKESENFKSILSKYKYINIIKLKKIFSMNQPKNHIIEEFNKHKVINLKMFWDALVFIYFKENSKKIKEKMNLAMSIFNEFIKLRDKIDTEEINLLQKICILKQAFIIFPECENEEDLKVLNFRYFILSKKKPNSILDKVDSFFKEFINNLTEESEVYNYILDEHCFDMCNLTMMKLYLTEYFPDILLFYNLKKSDSKAFTDRDNGTISINEFNLLKPFNNINKIDYNSYEQNYCDDIAMNIVLILLREYIGCRKFPFSPNKKINPKKFININKELDELKNDFNEKRKKSESILGPSDELKRDSEHNVELCYGRYNNEFIINLLSGFNDNGKFIRRADLFTTKCKVLEKYISLKLHFKNKNPDIFKNKSIEEEIQIMENNLNINKNSNLEHHAYLNKKRSKKETKNKMNVKESENNLKKKRSIIKI